MERGSESGEPHRRRCQEVDVHVCCVEILGHLGATVDSRGQRIHKQHASQQPSTRPQQPAAMSGRGGGGRSAGPAGAPARVSNLDGEAPESTGGSAVRAASRSAQPMHVSGCLLTPPLSHHAHPFRNKIPTTSAWGVQRRHCLAAAPPPPDRRNHIAGCPLTPPLPPPSHDAFDRLTVTADFANYFCT